MSTGPRPRIPTRIWTPRRVLDSNLLHLRGNPRGNPRGTPGSTTPTPRSQLEGQDRAFMTKAPAENCFQLLLPVNHEEHLLEGRSPVRKRYEVQRNTNEHWSGPRDHRKLLLFRILLFHEPRAVTKVLSFCIVCLRLCFPCLYPPGSAEIEVMAPTLLPLIRPFHNVNPASAGGCTPARLRVR